MFGPNYGAAQSHIAELMQEREDFIQASKAQARRVAELEASLAAATELHGAAQEQLEVQSLIAAHRATRIHELEEETRAQANTMGKCVEPPHCHSHPPPISAMAGQIYRTQHGGSRVACESCSARCPSIHPSTHLPIYPSTHLPIYPWQAARSRASLVGPLGKGAVPDLRRQRGSRGARRHAWRRAASASWHCQGRALAWLVARV
jgi:hypothetical protein